MIFPTLYFTFTDPLDYLLPTILDCEPVDADTKWSIQQTDSELAFVHTDGRKLDEN
jgi:hypothetical protein